MNKIHQDIVVILAKKPELGKVKTRIAKDTSEAFALKLAIASLDDLVINVNNSNYYDLVVATDNLEDLRWFEKNYGISGITLDRQEGADLSKKLTYIFQTLTIEYGYEKVILIPMDIPYIQSEEIISSFSRLENINYVLGPETNGGIYLIGMTNKSFNENIFDNVAWSTIDSSKTLLKNLTKANTYELKLKNDINTFPDILGSKELIQLSCPKLYTFLNSENYFSEEKRFTDFDTLDICLPTISVIIERQYKKCTEILMQTRYKPASDPKYSGYREIPSGLIKKYESAIDAAVREVKEETGISINKKEMKSNLKKFKIDKDNNLISYEPFCVSQQLKGSRSYLNIGFLFNLTKYKVNLVSNKDEAKDLSWVNIRQVQKTLEIKNNNIFPINIPILKKYFELKTKTNHERKQ